MKGRRENRTERLVEIVIGVLISMFLLCSILVGSVEYGKSISVSTVSFSHAIIRLGLQP
jgi:hypothetical protein